MSIHALSPPSVRYLESWFWKQNLWTFILQNNIYGKKEIEVIWKYLDVVIVKWFGNYLKVNIIQV